jgi:NAD(P)-dependent dehydrogenase (short-subunit alcohol dehydrogenase family)
MRANGRDLSHRVALVTGAAQGIGLACARRLLDDGASVALADVDAETARAACAELAESERAIVLGVDVRARDEVRAAVEATVARFGRLDMLIANAGVADVRPMAEIDDASWERVVSTNLTGAFVCIQEAARHMAPGAAVVVTASTNAFWMESNLAHYNASKAGVLALARTAALELAPVGIRVNAISPGLVRTRLTVYVTDDDKHAPGYRSQIPLGRFGQPADVAAAAAFLVSDDASWITGQNLVVDGGQTIGTPMPLPD